MTLLGKQIAANVEPPSCIYLVGQIGAGKTTFARGFIRGFGFDGLIKSPTFTLVESYSVRSYQMNHFDLFRLNCSEELEYIGVDEYSNAKSILLIEWPELGSSILPMPNITVHISITGQSRDVEITGQS